MLLDNDVVKIGDRLYHTSAGYGNVEALNNDTARVRMDSGGVLNMREGGYSGKKKTFYWYKPVAFLPRKGHEELHKKAIDMAISALGVIGIEVGEE